MPEDMQGSNTAAETTAPENSPAPEETAELSDVSADSQSSEDINTQSADVEKSTDNGETAKAKSESRYQQLANDNRRLAEENQQLKSTREEREENQDARAQQIQQQAIQSNDPGYRAEAQAALARYEVQRMKEREELREAAAKFPELNVGGENYDKDFHDLVWTIREGSGGAYDYAKAASLVLRDRERIASKAAHKAETEIAEKQSVSKQAAGTTTSAPRVTDGVRQAESKFSQTGNIDDLASVLAARRRN